MSRETRLLRRLLKGPQLVPGAVSTPAAPVQGPGDRGYSLPGLPGGTQMTTAPTKYEQDSVPVVNLIRDVSPNNWYSPFQPVAPFGPPYVQYPRDWDYQTGENLNFSTMQHRLQERLRQMASTWGVLRAIIQTRKDQLLRMPRDFQVRGQPRKTSKQVEEMRDFFRRPDGQHRFGTWMRMILEDLFVIDAPTLYVGHRSRGGQPLTIDVLDGATMKVLIDDAGRLPDFPSPAYQQIIKGLPMVNFTIDEIIYEPMNPVPEFPIYGMSPVQQIWMEIQEAIQKSLYTLGFWKDGNLPDLMVAVPEDWTASQIAAFQALMDTELAGNLAKKSKMRFVPSGTKPYDIKNASGEGLSSARDEVLIRLACYAFSVSPTPFIKAVNRATAQSAADAATQEGLHPLMEWFKESIMDPLVQEQFGYDEVEFVFKPALETDQLKQMQIITGYVDAGIMTRDEARDRIGMQPRPDEGTDELMITSSTGIQRLQDAVRAGEAAADSAERMATAPLPDPNRPAGVGGSTGGRPSGRAGSGKQRSDAGKFARAVPVAGDA